MVTNAMVVENELKCAAAVTDGIQQELEALAEFLELSDEWLDIDKLFIAIKMARTAVAFIQGEARELAGNVATLKEYTVRKPSNALESKGVA